MTPGMAFLDYFPSAFSDGLIYIDFFVHTIRQLIYKNILYQLLGMPVIYTSRLYLDLDV